MQGQGIGTTRPKVPLIECSGEGLKEKVTFELRPEAGGEAINTNICRRAFKTERTASARGLR